MRSALRWLLPAFCLTPIGASAIIQQSKPEYAGVAEIMGETIPGLATQDEEFAIRGRLLFKWNIWSPDPDVNRFNTRNCIHCHQEPEFGGFGVDPVSFVTVVPSKSDPTGWTLHHQRVRNETGRFIANVAPTGEFELRRSPALFGGGLLEAIPEAKILSWADPADKNKDGISGRPGKSPLGMGRFGWKANIHDLREFTISAFLNELGMKVQARDVPDFSSLGKSQVDAVTYYLQTISPPPRPKLSVVAQKGKKLFEVVDCNTCHVPEVVTGKSKNKVLSEKIIQAYTDLLLHDLSESGKELHSSPEVPGKFEFRTPPLWGIGMNKGLYWHDGSAKTLEQAIQKHGGEGALSRAKFNSLPENDKNALISFLKEL